MTEFFLKIVNMSISASWIVLAVLLLRLLLKKAPKWINVILWGIVGLRLVMPFTLESVFSLIPSAETVNPEIMMDKTPQINTGVPIINNAINPVISESFTPAPMDSANPLQIWIPIFALVWVIGIVAMVLYTVISFLRVKRKIGTAVLLCDNIYQSESVVSPFVLGILRPKIYLPFNMNEQEMAQVIAHENAHISRKDHLWKPLGFLILTLHWFNPLMWLGYVLLCRDIELACDEKVVKTLNNEQKADYSQALLACSVNRRIIAACPLAFGEVGVKKRIKSVLNYKKPAFWLVLTAIVLSIVVAVCFLTNPRKITLSNTKIPEALNLFDNVRELEIYIPGIQYDEFYLDDFEYLLDYLGNIEISENKISENRSFDRAKEYNVWLRYGDYYKIIHFDEECETFWIDDNVKPSFSYSVIDGEAVRKFFENSAKEYFSSPNISGTDSVKLSVNALKKIYPQFFGVSTDGGLTVYVWQMAENNYRCYLANTAMEAISDNSFAYTVKDSATIEEMKVILSSYDIDKSEITIQPVNNPLSSYYCEINDSYRAKVKAMFWGDTDSTKEETDEPSNLPEFETTVSYANWSDNSEINSGALNSGKLVIGKVRHLPIRKFDKLEDLEEFKNTFSGELTMEQGYNNVPSFNSVTAKYDKKFFKENSLLLVYVAASNASYRFKMQSVDYNDKSLCVHVVETTKPEVVITAMSGWFITVAVPDELIKNVTNFDADLDNVESNDSVVKKNAKYGSSIYTDGEIESAIKVIKSDFKKDWKGCTLKKIAYLGDERLKDYREFADRNNKTDVLVLTSDFYVAPTGADGSLNADSTYKDFKWILVRNKGEAWKHVDHGYP